MPLPVIRAQKVAQRDVNPLSINADQVAQWLIEFLKAEVVKRRGMSRVVLGLSGGVDSAVVAYLCAKAFGPENTFAFRMPYKISSQESLDHAQLVVDDLGIQCETIPITGMVDGYLEAAGEVSAQRLGNVCARSRMIVLFDQSAKVGGIPIGTGNKSERLFGYYTWHADDAPPINPLGDLFKVQVWELARALGVPSVIIDKPATADLVKGQILGLLIRRRMRFCIMWFRVIRGSRWVGWGLLKRRLIWCGSEFRVPTGSGNCRRWRCFRTLRLMSTICVPLTSSFEGGCPKCR